MSTAEGRTPIWIAIASAALGMESCRVAFSATAGVPPLGHSAVVGLALFATPFVVGGVVAAFSYRELVRLNAWRARKKDPDGGQSNTREASAIELEASDIQVALRESEKAPWLRVAFIIVVLSVASGAGLGGLLSLAFGADRDNVVGSIVSLGFVGGVLGTLIAIPAALMMKFMNRGASRF